MPRWIQDRETGELIPVDEYRFRDPIAPMVMPDIKGYKSMQTGEWIGSRSTHREHLKQHRLIEIGNEPIRESKLNYDPSGIKQELARHFR